jgi:hypothetical protein
VFSGQGPRWWPLGADLIAAEPVFRGFLERCDSVLRRHVEWSLLEQLTAGPDAADRRRERTAPPAPHRPSGGPGRTGRRPAAIQRDPPEAAGRGAGPPAPRDPRAELQGGGRPRAQARRVAGRSDGAAGEHGLRLADVARTAQAAGDFARFRASSHDRLALPDDRGTGALPRREHGSHVGGRRRRGPARGRTPTSSRPPRTRQTWKASPRTTSSPSSWPRSRKSTKDASDDFTR